MSKKCDNTFRVPQVRNICYFSRRSTKIHNMPTLNYLFSIKSIS